MVIQLNQIKFEPRRLRPQAVGRVGVGPESGRVRMLLDLRGMDGCPYHIEAVKRLALVLVLAASARLFAQPAKSESAKGDAVYRQACATCHMADGSGVAHLQPSIDGGNRVVVGGAKTLIALLLHGPQEALPADRERYSNEMPKFDTLSDDEIAAVLTYIRSSFGNKAPAITPRQVAAARAKR